MKRTPINPAAVPAPIGGYSLGLDVTGATRFLFISGQVPEAADGTTAEDFDGQCRQVWANIEAVLEGAAMDLDNLVKVTTFLTDRAHIEANRRVRNDVLGDRSPALTVIIAQTLDPRWLLEIEAYAAG